MESRAAPPPRASRSASALGPMGGPRRGRERGGALDYGLFTCRRVCLLTCLLALDDPEDLREGPGEERAFWSSPGGGAAGSRPAGLGASPHKSEDDRLSADCRRAFGVGGWPSVPIPGLLCLAGRGRSSAGEPDRRWTGPTCPSRRARGAARRPSLTICGRPERIRRGQMSADCGTGSNWVCPFSWYPGQALGDTAI
jgi:hypothetical protein